MSPCLQSPILNPRDLRSTTILKFIFSLTVLRSNNITTLVLFGISTSGVVLSTVRWAADMDYQLVVVSDACADRSEEVHRVLTEKIFPWQATVMRALLDRGRT